MSAAEGSPAKPDVRKGRSRDQLEQDKADAKKRLDEVNAELKEYANKIESLFDADGKDPNVKAKLAYLNRKEKNFNTEKAKKEAEIAELNSKLDALSYTTPPTSPHPDKRTAFVASARAYLTAVAYEFVRARGDDGPLLVCERHKQKILPEKVTFADVLHARNALPEGPLCTRVWGMLTAQQWATFSDLNAAVNPEAHQHNLIVGDDNMPRLLLDQRFATHAALFQDAAARLGLIQKPGDLYVTSTDKHSPPQKKK